MKEIINQYQPLWFSIAKKYSGDIHQSEELVQDALVRYLQTENADVKNVKAYVAKTIYHLYINQIRKDKIRSAHIKSISTSTVETNDQEKAFENQGEVRSQLSKMYRMLTPGERAVFVLRKAFDLDIESICELFRISNENCRQLLCRAKGKMQETGKPYFRQGNNEAAFVDSFFKASRDGNMQDLISILKRDLSRKYLKVSNGKATGNKTGRVVEIVTTRISTGIRA